MYRRMAGTILPLVLLAVIAALTIGCGTGSGGCVPKSIYIAF